MYRMVKQEKKKLIDIFKNNKDLNILRRAIKESDLVKICPMRGNTIFVLHTKINPSKSFEATANPFSLSDKQLTDMMREEEYIMEELG